ncbi:MAG: DUF4398 domain-containing protein [Gammaproteobacteria bacterium]|nr:DUF4398 domain-containing protein [Gammaproteobacteria bacterium]MDH5777565.1 DUF4398 domain-containing protein [Gammaproteobacteria bacterium]
MTVRTGTRFNYMLIFLTGIISLAACAVPAPVQEMSNARQSLQAAKAARAEVYANQKYQQASKVMQEATRQLESGDYLQARDLALEAKQLATSARQQALNKYKK